MRALVLILCSIVMAVLSGCADHSSDDRLRKVLGIASSTNISEAVVTERVLSIIPVGTVEPEIAKKVAALGVGNDKLSGYTLTSDRSTADVNIESDPSTFRASGNQWVITFHLDSSMKLSSVTTKRYEASQ